MDGTVARMRNDKKWFRAREYFSGVFPAYRSPLPLSFPFLLIFLLSFFFLLLPSREMVAISLFRENTLGDCLRLTYFPIFSGLFRGYRLALRAQPAFRRISPC